MGYSNAFRIAKVRERNRNELAEVGIFTEKDAIALLRHNEVRNDVQKSLPKETSMRRLVWYTYHGSNPHMRRAVD